MTGQTPASPARRVSMARLTERELDEIRERLSEVEATMRVLQLDPKSAKVQRLLQAALDLATFQGPVKGNRWSMLQVEVIDAAAAITEETP
jgi:hypothetical protein